MDTNLYVQVHLHEDKLVCEVDVGSFQFPPMQDVEFGRPDTHPGMEDRREELERFFREKCPVEVDGITVQPILTSLKLEDFEAADHLMQPMDIVYVGVQFEYPLKQQPKRIAMKWGFFAQPGEADGAFPEGPDDPALAGDGLAHDPQEIVADFIIHGERDEYDLVYFSPTEPEYIWHRPAASGSDRELAEITSVRSGAGGSGFGGATVRHGLLAAGAVLAVMGGVALTRTRRVFRYGAILGVASVACFAGALLPGSRRGGALTPEQAIETFRALHANIYAAFDHNTEDEIYDALAQSVDGPLLDHVYNDVFESLILRSEGGVMAKVQQVETLETEVTALPDDSSDSCVIDCAWRVHGFVKHYSHTHRRLNEYHATYEMAPRGDSWKIVKSVETKRERLDGQVPGSSAGGVLPPSQGEAAPLPDAFEDAAGGENSGQDAGQGSGISNEIPENLNLPGILDGNTME